MKQLHVSEIKLNSESAGIELELPLSRQLLHRFVGSDQYPSLVVNVHVLLQLVGYIAGIGYDDAVDILVNGAEDITVIDKGLGKLQIQ